METSKCKEAHNSWRNKLLTESRHQSFTWSKWERCLPEGDEESVYLREVFTWGRWGKCLPEGQREVFTWWRWGRCLPVGDEGGVYLKEIREMLTWRPERDEGGVYLEPPPHHIGVHNHIFIIIIIIPHPIAVSLFCPRQVSQINCPAHCLTSSQVVPTNKSRGLDSLSSHTTQPHPAPHTPPNPTLLLTGLCSSTATWWMLRTQRRLKLPRTSSTTCWTNPSSRASP